MSATQHYEEMTAKVKDMVPDAIKEMVAGTNNEMHTSVRTLAPPCDMCCKRNMEVRAATTA